MTADVLRVCLVLETYWPQVGGGESAGRHLARGLAARGCRVTVLTRRSVPGTLARERDGDVHVRRLPPTGSGPWMKWFLTLPVLAALAGSRGEHDVLVGLGFRVLGAPLVLAGAWLGIPVVLKAESRGEMSGEFFRPGMAAHGLAPTSPAVRGFLAIRDAVLATATGFVAMTGELAAELDAAGIGPDRVHGIPNPVDTARFSPPDAARRATVRRDLGIDGTGRVVLYTGRLVEYKGLPELIEAWPLVARKHPGARLVLLGEAGTDPAACEDVLVERIESHGIGDSVILPGPTDDVLPWLEAADGFVFPSRDEAFGLSAVEAMACGLPLVTTPVGALADTAVDEQNALVVPPGDRAALQAALLRLVEGGRDVEALGPRAREAVEARFAADVVLEAWHGLLGRTVEG